jgi:hypothetical protein
VWWLTYLDNGIFQIFFQTNRIYVFEKAKRNCIQCTIEAPELDSKIFLQLHYHQTLKFNLRFNKSLDICLIIPWGIYLYVINIYCLVYKLYFVVKVELISDTLENRLIDRDFLDAMLIWWPSEHSVGSDVIIDECFKWFNPTLIIRLFDSKRITGIFSNPNYGNSMDLRWK